MFLVCQHLSLGGCTSSRVRGRPHGKLNGKLQLHHAIGRPNNRGRPHERVCTRRPEYALELCLSPRFAAPRWCAPSSVHRKLWHVSARIAAADHVGTWPRRQRVAVAVAVSRIELRWAYGAVVLRRTAHPFSQPHAALRRSPAALSAVICEAQAAVCSATLCLDTPVFLHSSTCLSRRYILAPVSVVIHVLGRRTGKSLRQLPIDRQSKHPTITLIGKFLASPSYCVFFHGNMHAVTRQCHRTIATDS